MMWKRWEREGRPRKAYATKFFYAITKYQPENFTIELLETTTKELADEREQFYVIQYDSVEDGYNLTNGGQGWVGLNLNDEHKKNLSVARSRFYKTDEGKEWKKQLSERLKIDNPCKKGNIPWNKGIKTPQTGNGKTKCYIVTSPNGKVFEVVNMKKFCRDNGLDDRNICRTSSKGYRAKKAGA